MSRVKTACHNVQMHILAMFEYVTISEYRTSK